MTRKLLSMLYLLFITGVLTGKAATFTTSGDTLFIGEMGSLDLSAYKLDSYKDPKYTKLVLSTKTLNAVNGSRLTQIAGLFKQGSGFYFDELDVSDVTFALLNPKTVTKQAFMNCVNLKTVILSNNTRAVGVEAVKNSGLEQIKIAGKDYDGTNTLPDMFGLELTLIPDLGISLVTKNAVIGEGAFEGTRLENFCFPRSEERRVGKEC